DYVVRARVGGTAERTSEGTAQAVDSALAAGLGAGQYKIVRTEAVGPKVGRELQGKAFLAIFFSFIVTLIYLAIRFEWRFGLAAPILMYIEKRWPGQDARGARAFKPAVEPQPAPAAVPRSKATV